MKLVFSFILLACVAATPSHGEEVVTGKLDAELLDRFNSEAPKAWRKAKEDYLRYANTTNRKRDVQIESAQYSPTAKKLAPTILEHKNISMKVGKDYGLLKGGLEDKSDSETVAIYNKSYYAMLQRKKGSEDWLLTSIGPIPELESDVSLPDALGEVNRVLFFASDPQSESVHPFDENPFIKRDAGVTEKSRAWPDLRNRKITNIESIDYDGKDMVEVTMTFEVSVIDWSSGSHNTYKSKNQPWKYTAVFDPTNDWSLNKVTGGVLQNGQVINELSRKYSYTKINGFFACDGYKEKVIEKKTGKVLRLVERTNKVTKTSYSPEQFTVSAFGLPEPDWYRPPTPWWLYSSITGLALIIIGATIFRFGKKLI